MLFREVPFLDRFELAANAGFTDVEFLFPYQEGVDNIRSRIADSGSNIILFDAPPGDLLAGEFGTLCLPHRKEYFHRSFELALAALERLNCQKLNILFGNRMSQFTVEAQMNCALENLQWALPMAKQAGITLLLEPLSKAAAPACMLHDTKTAMQIIGALRHPSLKLQYDFFHAQLNEGNLINTVGDYFDYIGHIQIADAPDRHEPGTGEINYKNIFAKLAEWNYEGFIGLEYTPSIESLKSFTWLHR